MVQMGYSRDWLQCRQKIKNRKNDYKKIKDNNKQTNRKGRKERRYFELLNKILGSRDSVEPSCILESMRNNDGNGNTGQYA